MSFNAALSDDLDDCQGNTLFDVAQRIWVGKSLNTTNEINNYERQGEPAKPVNVQCPIDEISPAGCHLGGPAEKRVMLSSSHKGRGKVPSSESQSDQMKQRTWACIAGSAPLLLQPVASHNQSRQGPSLRIHVAGASASGARRTWKKKVRASDSVNCRRRCRRRRRGSNTRWCCSWQPLVAEVAALGQMGQKEK